MESPNPLLPRGMPERLRIFCPVLQGIFNKQRVRKEVEDMIADLQLVGKSKIQSSRLSGGMKRKLR